MTSTYQENIKIQLLTLARPSSQKKNHQATEARGATPIFTMHWFYQVERWWSCLLPFNNNRHAAVATAHLRSLETFRKQTEELSESPRNRQTGRPRAKPHDFWHCSNTRCSSTRTETKEYIPLHQWSLVLMLCTTPEHPRKKKYKYLYNKKSMTLHLAYRIFPFRRGTWQTEPHLLLHFNTASFTDEQIFRLFFFLNAYIKMHTHTDCCYLQSCIEVSVQPFHYQ